MTKVKESFKGYLKGVHKCKDHSRVKLYKIVKSNKGQADIFGIVGLVYLVLMLVVLIVIF